MNLRANSMTISNVTTIFLLGPEATVLETPCKDTTRAQAGNLIRRP